MRTATRAARDHTAHSRLVAAAAKLAERYSLPGELVQAVQVQRGDPATRAMYQREAVVDLLEALITATEPQPQARAVKPAEEPEEEPRGKRGRTR